MDGAKPYSLIDVTYKGHQYSNLSTFGIDNTSSSDGNQDSAFLNTNDSGDNTALSAGILALVVSLASFSLSTSRVLNIYTISSYTISRMF